MIDMVAGRAQITFRLLELWSKQKARVPVSDFAQVAGRDYLRFNVEDRPSVLAEIASILGRQNISIASVIQHEADEQSGVVPLVIMTHRTTEGATQRAIDTIDRLQFMRGGSVRMRVDE